jgi:hypothetical protein
MTAAYAQDTKVPVDRSRAEIERNLIRFGASGFGYAWQGGKEQVIFTFDQKQVRMEVPMPDKAEYRTDEPFQKERRRRWRSLAMIVKAKLVAVSDGITTFEDEFLSYFVTPDGTTIGQRLIPRLNAAALEGRLPPLLEGHK